MDDEFHRPDLLASDLDWIITSTQVEDNQVIRFLLVHFLPRVYFIALLLDIEPAQAWSLSSSVIEEAVRSRYKFSGDHRAEIWLYKLMIEYRMQNSSFWLSRSNPPLQPPELEITAGVVFASLMELPFRDRLKVCLNELCSLTEEDAQLLLEQCAQLKRNEFGWLKKRKPGLVRPVTEPELAGKIKKWNWTALFSDKVDNLSSQFSERLAEQKRKRKWFLGVLQAGLLSASLVFMFFIGNHLPYDKLQQNQGKGVVVTVLMTRLVYVTETPSPSPTSTPLPNQAILVTAFEGETLRQLARRTWTDVALLAKYNGRDPDAVLQVGEQIMVAANGPPLSERPSTPIPEREVKPVIGLDSQINDIIWQMSNTFLHWSTLHLDGIIFTYPQPGFYALPQVTRGQVWISRPRYSLILEGKLTGEIQTVWRNESNRVYIQDNETGSRNIIYRINIDYTELGQHVYPPVSILNGPERQSFRLVRSEQVAERDTVILEWVTHQAGSYPSGLIPVQVAVHSFLQRWWVDTETGIILRRQVYWDSAGKDLAKEILITKALVDINLPNSLFDHFQPMPENFGDDFLPQELSSPDLDLAAVAAELIQVASLQKKTPPVSFDPAMGNLVFEWQDLAEAGNQSTLPAFIYSDGYYLGAVDMGGPLELICRRSPDGSKVAFTSGGNWPAYPGGPLRWFDLRSFAPAQTILPDIYPYEWAFSSTGQFLAIHGCSFNYQCRIYLADLETGLTTPLVYFDEVVSLTWLPDDKYLALIGARYRGEAWKEFLVDVNKAEVVREGVSNAILSFLAQGIVFPRPVDTWGHLLYQPCTSYSKE
jgi:hypothetical protein